MAMIKCPECEKMISDKAQICPNCGCEMRRFIVCKECGTRIDTDINSSTCPECGRPINLAKRSTSDLMVKVKANRKKLAIIVGVCMLLIVALIVVITVTKSTKNEMYYDVVDEYWEAYYYVDGSERIDYDDLSEYEKSQVEIELYLDSDGTYELYMADTDISGKWDIKSNGKIILDSANGDSLTLYYDNVTKTISMEVYNSDAEFYLKKE